MALVALSGIAQAIAAGAAALATREVFAALHGSGTMAVSALGIILAAGLAIALLRLAERTVAEWIGQHYAAELRQSLFAHLARLSPRDIAMRRSGSLALRFVGDLSTVRSWVSLGIARIVSAAFVFPGAIFALWLINPSLALAGAVVLCGAFALMAVLQRHLAPLHRRLRGLRARIAADMGERVTVASELRLQRRIGLEARRLDKTALRLRRAAMRRTMAASGLKAIPEVALAATGVLFLGLAFQLGLRAAETAAALALLGILAVPMTQLAVIWDRHRAWQVARDKCRSLLNLPELVRPSASENDNAAKGLHLEAVSDPHLNKISGEIPPGWSVALLGPNGAGKSALLSLIAGLNAPDSGRITLDGKPLRARQVCYLGPHSPILRGSLRRAFTMGVTRRPADEEIVRRAEKFGLAPLLDRLGGLEGQVAEAGRNLSAGEKRRLHLVRASLSQARVLLLDEPEEALDPQGRRLVSDLIKEGSATTVFVTHDLALARAADEIWFLADGEVQAVGTLEAALSASGPVRDFVHSGLAA